MDFKSFVRQVGGASSDPLVGSDPTPSGAASKANKCAFNLKSEGKSGVNFVQRLAVSYTGPAATLPVTVWIFDQKSENWIITGTGSITPNGMTRFDLICPVEDGTSNVSIDVYVQVSDPGGLAGGIYTFLVAEDASLAVSVVPAAPAANVTVTNFPANYPVTVTATVLPAGAATATKQDAGNTFLSSIDADTSSIDTKTPALGQALAGASTPVVLPALQETSLRDISDRAGRLLGHVTVDTSALPSGAATEAKQDTGNTSLASIDTKTPAQGQALAASSSPVVLPSLQETSLRDVSDRAARLLGHVTVDSSALPAGAATEAKQDTGNTSLASIDGKVSTAAKQDTGNSSLASIDTKTPALGQALAANSVPSVLPALQETSLRDMSDRAARLVGVVTGAAGAALALDSTLTGGTAKSIARGGAKGATTAADLTGTAQGADHQGLDVQVRDTSGNPMPSMDVASRKGFVAVTDGTNTQAVKAASTAALATDPAAVVSFSPNSPLPAGTALIGSAVQRPASGSADVTTAHNSGTGTLVQKEDGVKGSAGNLFSFLAYNSSTSPRWIYVYDALTATGTVIHVLQVPPKDQAAGTFGYGSTDFPYGRRFSTGLSWAASTTPPGTAFNAAGAEIYAEMEYV